MTTKHTMFLRFVKCAFALFGCFCLSPGVALAQVDSQNHLQIDPPPIPRYRRPKPAFVISADPDSKPLPLPTVRHVETGGRAEVTPPKPSSPSPEQLERRRARVRQIQRKEVEAAAQKDRYLAVAKVLSALIMAGVGIFSITDIARQIRKAKQAASLPPDDEENDWEP